MLFRRRKKHRERVLAESLACARHPYRTPVDPETLLARIVREGRDQVQAGVVNLSLEGVNIEVPFHLDPGLDPGEVVSLELRHSGEAWRIDTPAQVEQHQPNGGAHVRYGLTFLNMGSLYAQMEDTLGRYFNRRRHQRIRPDQHQDILVRLRQGGQKPRGTMHDLSVSGMCVALDLVAATAIQQDRPIEFAFELPGYKGTLEGLARAVSKRRLGRREFLSLEFETEDGKLAAYAGDLAAYVDERARLMAAFSAQLAPR